jgi:hypothetical protein
MCFFKVEFFRCCGVSMQRGALRTSRTVLVRFSNGAAYVVWYGVRSVRHAAYGATYGLGIYTRGGRSVRRVRCSYGVRTVSRTVLGTVLGPCVARRTVRRPLEPRVRPFRSSGCIGSRKGAGRQRQGRLHRGGWRQSPRVVESGWAIRGFQVKRSVGERQKEARCPGLGHRGTCG